MEVIAIWLMAIALFVQVYGVLKHNQLSKELYDGYEKRGNEQAARDNERLKMHQTEQSKVIERLEAEIRMQNLNIEWAKKEMGRS